MKHLKLFKTSKDLQDFKDGKDYITPYLYYQEQSNEIGVNQESIPNNEIWYTYRKSVFINNSGGGEEHALEAIQPKSKHILGNSEEHTYIPQGPFTFDPSAFNANIVSEDYMDGYGIITFDDDVTIVGEGAFNGCDNLLSITLPQTVTEIGDYAFYYCSNLTGITIPDSVASIGYYAFGNCDGLAGITLPDSVANIGEYAFYSCDRLTGITIPNFVTNISSNAFQNCSSLTTVEFGSGVTSIGNYAFQNCYRLTGITIPDSVTSIGNYAFQSCYNLTGITIPNSVTSIGVRAFNNCDGLTGVTIPDSVTSIGNDAFYDCQGLTTVEIGSGVTSIGEYAFYYCSNLTTVEIGSGCTSIGNYAFSNCSSLKEITCHANTAPSIGSYTFNSIASYGILIHPDGSDYSSWLSASTYYLGYYSWGDGIGEIKCTYNITSIDEPTRICYSTNGIYKMEVDGVEIEPTTGYTFNKIGKHIIEFTSLNIIASSAFYNCSSLTNVEIGSGITSIGNYTFEGCSNLTTVEIGSGVTSIGSYVFENCSSLKEITCHAITAPSINSNTFKYITSYGLLIYPEGSDYSSWLSTSSYYLGYYNWGNKVAEVICTYNITSANTPANICKSTNSIYKMEVDGIEIKPTSAYTFNEPGEHVIEFTFLNNIPSSAFKDCSNLTKVEMGSGCTSIGEYAFNLCSNLTGITIPDSVTSIGEYAFYYCSNLTTVEIGSGCTTINSQAFASCSKLTEITIPDSVTSIGGGAFGNCSGLTSIIVSSGNTVYDSRENCNAIIETATNTLIKGCDTTIIPDLVRSIGDYAFWGCSNLTGITIPDSVTSIGDYAFWGCSNLTGITIPDSVISIGRSAFNSCEGLTGITIPNSVTNIDSYAFRNCFNLTGITIPDSVTSIGEYAFYYCSNLTTVEIGSGCTSIGNYAFSDCPKLKKITCHANIAPSIGKRTFKDVAYYGLLIHPDGSDYSSWLSASTYYLGYYSWGDGIGEIKCTYNITSIDEPTRICNYTSGVLKMEVDGVEIEPTSAYTFNEPGEHVIEFASLNKIRLRAFSNCSSLTNVEIGNGCTNISDSAFTNCNGLTTVEIGDEITSIGNFAFYNCSSLKEITCHAITAPSISSNTFYSIKSNGLLIHPDGSDYSSWLSTGGSYLGYYGWSNKTCKIKNIYNITSTNTPTKICYSTDGILKIEVDGIEIEPFSTGCTFNEIGEHVVEFTSLDKIPSSAFTNCSNLTIVEIGSGCTSIGNNVFYNCSNLKTVEIGSGITSVGDYAFQSCSSLKKITCHAITAPSISSNTFKYITSYGLLIYPEGSDYSSWLSTSSYYLGYYGWTGDTLYQPQTYYDLEITAEDVNGRATTTIITWRCLSDGVDTLTNEILTGVELTGTAISNTFEQNTSETDVIERTITFEYMGLSASTVITQGVWINQYYALDLNSQWQSSTITNPDSTLYDGVYESFSNKGVNNTAAIMYIDIVGYESFSLYIRSYAESSYDYVMVSQLDQTITNNSSYSDTTLVKAHTRGNQQSGTALSNYKLVEFTGIDGGEHRITVVYRKDSSAASGDDKGYILIPKNQ